MREMINFMDLKRQYEIHKEGIFDAFKQVCEETAFSGGKFVEKFEREFAQYCNTKFASGVNSGTTALHVAMIALGIGPGDEVIIPANTFIATAWGPTYVGATPVFVDCTSDTWEIDASKIEAVITKKTKAIIGVHLYGQPFDFDEVKKIADKYELYVVEDCAQAHGAIYKEQMVGSLGEIGCFSFYPGKNLGSYGEGGAVTSNNKGMIDYINKIKNHGSSVRYFHDEVGYNFRLEGIQGAILSYKLKHISDWTKRRQDIANMYFEGINNSAILMQKRQGFCQSVYHLFVVMSPDREKFSKHLYEHQIGCGQHYPVPCHLQKVYSHLGYKKGDMPNSENLALHCSSLPMFPELTDEEIIRVIDACNSFRI